MGILKETFNQYKWAVLAGVIVAILIAVITVNLHVLQFVSYKVQNDAAGVLSVLQGQVRNEEVQDDWFFEQGMQYLLAQEEYGAELSTFFEEQFAGFTLDWKKEIIKAYAKKQMNLPMSKELMDVLVQNVDDESIRSYLSKLSISDFEQGLVLTYGNNPEVNNEFVESLSKILSIYPNKLPFDLFQFNLYQVLDYTGENSEEVIKFIFSKVDAAVAKENIFKQLRTKELTEKELCEWVEFFNSTGMIAANEYASFNEIYGNICLIRNQYNSLDTEEVQLKNKIAEIEAMLGDKETELKKKQEEMAPLENEISTIEASLESLTNYSYMPLYIERPSGTGNNEYIASVPRSGIFGMKPSDLKYIIKLTSTSFIKKDVYNLNLYTKGTKAGTDGGEYTYFVEASASDLDEIEAMKSERISKINALEEMEQEANAISSEIQSIKKENEYDDTKEALDNISTRRDEYKSKINEEIVKIRKLFGLANINISLETNSESTTQNNEATV